MTPHIKHSKPPSIFHHRSTRLAMLTAAIFLLCQPARSIAAPSRTAVLTDTAKKDDNVKKEKRITKSYNVTSGDKLQIDNQFGKVVVSTWDKNEITVDIVIEAFASTDEKAASMLDQLNVTDERNGNLISFKTNIGGNHEHVAPPPPPPAPSPSPSPDGDKEMSKEMKEKMKEMKEKGKEMAEKMKETMKEKWKYQYGPHFNHQFHIDYIIHMPSTNPLSITNSFGRTEISDFKGPLTVISKFGSLQAGKLENVEALNVEFGEADIAAVNNGKVAFKYNEASNIDKVDGNVKITSEFSNNVVIGFTDNIQECALFESYSNLRLIVNKNLSADINIHTSFGTFHNDSGIEIKAKEDDSDYGPHFDKDYSGRSGDGKGKIKIKSSFGTIHLTDHPAGPDGKKVKGNEKVI